MAAKAGLDALRAQVLTTTGAEERVEVNQRHLIDKILARYSAEFVVYRELMQNSDDAGAKAVEIHFQTSAPDATEAVPNLRAKLSRVLFKNNGMDFRQEDWNRLKKIAEGNPDESKIGAFGVGFYSLFSICEEPFVSSGKECMAFYWRNDQLYAKRATVPIDETEPNAMTTFLLDLREPMDMVSMDEFGPFLARAIGFTTNLREISVYLNKNRLLHITKAMSDAQPMMLPKTMYTVSPQKIFTIKSIELQSIQLEATILNVSNWTREVSYTNARIFLKTASGQLDVKVSKQQAVEMERSTKKYPPSQTKIQILYSNFDEKEASSEKKAIFKDLVPFPEQGRIFIGFPTHQTTGFCGHVAGRFIPTVERESLDFIDKCLQLWNHELLSMAGMLARTLYEEELAQIGKMYAATVLTHGEAARGEDDGRTWLENRASYALQAFQFHNSTPSPLVSRYIDGYFEKMSRDPLSMLTSRGVTTLDKVRIPDTTISQFLTSYPIISTSVYDRNTKMMDKLEKEGRIVRFSFQDVLSELEKRSFTEIQLAALLRWWLAYPRQTLTENQSAAFFQAALVTMEDGSVKPLSSFRWFLNPKTITTDVALPSMVVPYSLSKVFSYMELVNMFGQRWQELPLLEWVKFIINDPDFELSPHFSEKVLGIISRGWTTITAETQTAMAAMLSRKQCIPTNKGMRLPAEAYFPTVKLFDDLPLIAFQQPRSVSEKTLVQMGVRKTVELQLVFSRLVNEGSWDHMQLVKYLASVRESLSEKEMKRLRVTSIFPKDMSPNKPVAPLPSSTSNPTGESGASSASGSPAVPPKVVPSRYPASELYAPSEVLTALGLPIIEWKGRWSTGSSEGQLLLSLGLLTSPPLPTILALCALPNPKEIRAKALAYLIDNIRTLYGGVYSGSQVKIPFIPTTVDGVLELPANVFAHPSNATMGFPVMHGDLTTQAALLGVREYPQPALLLKRLESEPPRTLARGREIFEYLAKFQADFSHQHWAHLRQLEFIPTNDQGVLVNPQGCYFDKKDAGFHPDLLTLIDFGKTANLFLASCGVKEEPSPVELAQLVVRSPDQFLRRNGADKYKALLRQIASHMHVIRGNKPLLQEMMQKPFLLYEKRISSGNDAEGESTSGATTDGADGADQDQVVVYCELATAKQIYLNDDSVLQQIFSPLCCPMESILESFYEYLGSTWLSKNVRETYKQSGGLSETKQSISLQERIKERAPLLLSDQRQNQGGLYHDADWLATKLRVRQVPRLELQREFLPTGKTRSEPTTACVMQDTSRNHYLLVTPQGEVDFFDVADSLAKLVLKKRSLNDSFLWSSLLSLPLHSLKRKGYPVDRILNAKRAEVARLEAIDKANAAAAAAAAAALAASQLSPAQTAEYLAKLKDIFPDCDPSFLAAALAKETKDHVSRVTDQMLALNGKYPKVPPKPVPGSFPGKGPDQRISQIQGPAAPAANGLPPIPTSNSPFGSIGSASGLFGRFKSLSGWGSKDPTPTGAHSPTPSTEEKKERITSGGHTSTSGPPVTREPESATDSVTSMVKSISADYQKNLANSLKTAIDNCKPNNQNDINSAPTVSQVSETTTNSYCDAKPGHSLNFAGYAGGLEFYLDKSCVAEEIKTDENLRSLSRFVKLLMTLAGVFELKPETMHVYYDPSGPTVAFNRGGSLYFNWRYFVGYGHDTAALAKIGSANNKMSDEGLIYWFFTMAHELAHNFVGEHNSRHEFFFSSFAEQYLPNLIKVMTAASLNPSGPTSAAPSPNPEAVAVVAGGSGTSSPASA